MARLKLRIEIEDIELVTSFLLKKIEETFWS